MTRFLSLYGATRPQWVNSLWPSEAKWQHRSGSILAQVMDHRSMAPNHYLNHCSLIIREVLWASTEGNTVSQEVLNISILDVNLTIINLRLQPHLRGGSPILDVQRPHAVRTHNNLWIQVSVNKMKTKSISERAIIGFDHGLPCRVNNMALGPQLRQKPRPRF